MTQEKYYTTFIYKKLNQDEYCKVIIGKIEDISLLDSKVSFFIPTSSFDFKTYSSGKKRLKK